VFVGKPVTVKHSQNYNSVVIHALYFLSLFVVDIIESKICDSKELNTCN